MQQAKLICNVEYHLVDHWIKVQSGTIVNFCEETETAYVANERELFHCHKDHIEVMRQQRLALVPRVEAPHGG